MKDVAEETITIIKKTYLQKSKNGENWDAIPAWRFAADDN